MVINYFSPAAGVTSQVRLFTGRIQEPSWNPMTRLLTCACSDQLQQRAEQLSVAQIDALTPCFWSVDVFEPAEGRSRWEYLEERLSTMRASVDCDAYGVLRLSTWYAGQADFVFGPDTTVYQSISVAYADLGTLTNAVEIEADYRFPRLHQRVSSYSWSHPGLSGVGGIQGFCAWRLDSSELPDIEMVRSATESGGQVYLGGQFLRLPPSNGDPCGTGQGWTNIYTELILSGSWSGARRWVQSVTEQYRLRVEAPGSVASVGEVIARTGSALEIESERADRWESSTESAGGQAFSDELRDEPRRLLFLRCLLEQAVTTIVKAH
ncbi:hypothetical protein LLE81_11170, partial [Staphylococcus epidermidis]|nr:hypothetical protein [Staphylococcus epidermidis]